MMQWIIVTKGIGALNSEQEYTGPFETYDDAMAVFQLMGPASSYEHKFIVELFTAEERLQLNDDSDLVSVGDAIFGDG